MSFRKIILIFLILFSIPSKTIATEDVVKNVEEKLNINSFLAEAKKYTEDVFDDFNYKDIIDSAIKGDIDEENIAEKIMNIMGIEIKKQLSMIGTIIIIVVIHSILKSISDGMENHGVSQISYFVQYILIVTIVMSNFSEIVSGVKKSTNDLVGFSYSLIPLLLALMMTSGNIVSASAVQPILLVLITFIGSFISSFLLPFVLIGTSLGIISKISEKVQIDRIAKTFKSSTVWILGVVLTLFTTVLSLESSLTGKIDKVTAKTAKAVVSNAIPIVGKLLSDTTETVLGSGLILKNAIGIVGVIVIIGICAAPIIKLGILSVFYHILSAVCEPIADKKIIDIIEQMRDTFKVLLAIESSVAVMLIIGITIVINISSA